MLFHRRCVSLLILCFVSASSLFVQGQSTYGSVSGVVVDSSGAAIVDAQVTLTNLGTQEKRTQPSGPDGLFTFVNLFKGEYRIDAEKPGFKHFVRSPIAVEVQQTAHIDVTLQVGEVSQTVEVTGETPLLQPETSSLGQVVDTRSANELPLNGRNIYNLTTITPSVVPQGNTTGTVVGKNPFDFANYQIGGAFANEAAEYLDGQPLNIGYINLPLAVPTQDSITEFKVQYNNLGPEWGKFAGGVINLSTKSGTNTWHGSAYEYLRNKVFNSNEFFNKEQELSTGKKNQPVPFTQNQFGATIGGPVIKNKTFVFGSWEAFRLRSATVFSTNVPTVAERTGDFSGAGVTIYNPLSVNPNPLTSDNKRTAFPNNCLSSTPLVTPCNGDLINPTSKFLLKYFPLPNSTSAATNFIKASSTGGNIDEYVARGDQTINSKSTIFGRFTYWKLKSLAQDPFGTGFCKDRCAEDTKSKSLALGYNYTINPNTTANINASISRFQYIRNPINSGFDFTQEGWPAAYNPLVPGAERTPLTPCLAISDPLVTCSQGQSAIADYNTQFNISPQITMIHGRHTFVFGGQLEEGYDNYLQTNTGGGLISFNGSWTQSLARNASGAAGGLDIADFLLGYGLGQGAQFGNQTTGSLVISGPVSGKQTYRAFFFGDTWHATSKLTLNLGVRYELQGPWSERHDKMTYFDPAVTNASVTGCSGVAGSPCPGDLFLVASGPGVPNGVNKTRNNLPLSKKEILPRLGFAYAANSKTVVRGGFGIFFIPNYVSFGANPYVDPVSSATSNFFASNDAGLTPSATLNANTCTLAAANAPLVCAGQGPFNQNSSTLVAVPGRNPQPNVSQYILTQNNFSATGYTVEKYGYLEQYNLDIQRELPGGFFADIAYAGSHGVHLEQFNTHINDLPDNLIAQAQQQFLAGQPVTIALQPFTPGPGGTYPFSQNLPGALGCNVGAATCNLRKGQLNRPYPQYAGLNLNGYGCCSSSYNALQATLTRRFQGGGTLLVAYTNAKLMSNTDTLTSWLEGGTSGGVGNVQDWNNLKGERSLSSQDVSQRMVVSYVLDLPFGHGKRFASGMSGAADKVVSGWGLDGVTTLQRGFPVKISDGTGNDLTALGLTTGNLRPSVVAGCGKSKSGSSFSRVKGWFNTSCFDHATGYTFGNEPRVDASLRQQGVVNFDFSIFKKTTIYERVNFEFRTEFFNLFNHPQFGPPNGTCNPLASGTCLNPASNFGVITNTVNLPRLIQFGLKLSF